MGAQRGQVACSAPHSGQQQSQDLNLWGDRGRRTPQGTAGNGNVDGGPIGELERDEQEDLLAD